ncbi:MAG: hypothetical protein M0P77_06100 [Firmicutes bacterium]|nr:hypothetical protein [Bacillota bacterium]
MENSSRKNPARWIEISFNISYLLIVFVSAFLLYKTAQAGDFRWKFAIMSFLLGAGDSFHLIPRIISLLDCSDRDYTVSLGLGKLITSVTMTVFYLFLWEIGKEHYALDIKGSLSTIVYCLALLRIILSLLPQNRWTHKNPSLKWGSIRNIPFLILGAIVMFLFLAGAIIHGGALSFLWLAILISFACYMPVVLFVHKNRKLGMLMLPKSCAYVAIVLMGFFL